VALTVLAAAAGDGLPVVAVFGLLVSAVLLLLLLLLPVAWVLPSSCRSAAGVTRASTKTLNTCKHQTAHVHNVDVRH
jgi:hypothetical protein